MQEVFIDHQASHIALQMQNVSPLSPRAGASIGSAPSQPGWLSLANTSGGHLSRLFSIPALLQRNRILSMGGRQHTIFLKSRIPLPCLAFHLYNTCHNTDHLWALLTQQSTRVLVDALMKKENPTTHMQLKRKTVETLILNNKWWIEMLLPNYQLILQSTSMQEQKKKRRFEQAPSEMTKWQLQQKLCACVCSLWMNSDAKSHPVPVKARNSNSYHNNSFTFAVCKYL